VVRFSVDLAISSWIVDSSPTEYST
jgi:hypothetical protein